MHLLCCGRILCSYPYDMSGSTSSAHDSIGMAQRLVDQLQNDLRSLCTEAKRKNKPVTDAAENALMRVKTIIAKYGSDVQAGLLANSSETFSPFLMACETKQPRLVTISLAAIQRLIQAGCATSKCADSIVAVLWQLMDAHIEELRLLQTAALLVNVGGDVARHDTLAKALVLCFRLHFGKDQATVNTAAATIKQLVSVVFERAVAEDSSSAVLPEGEQPQLQQSADSDTNSSVLTAVERRSLPPKTLRPCASDAYMLFQDFCFLVNGESPHWLIGISEMTRTLCLELIESALATYSLLFLSHSEFCALVKERVCPMVIRLFSPNIKPRLTPSPSHNTTMNAAGSSASSNNGISVSGNASTATLASSAQSATHFVPGAPDKPFFPITMRIMRIVHTLIRYYFRLMLTESEIFLSLLAKLTDSEKSAWQRVLAVEVIASIFRNAALVRSIVVAYDSKPQSTKILADLVSALAAFIQSCFLGASSMSTSTSRNSLSDVPVSNQTPMQANPLLPGGSAAVQPVIFVYRGVSVPLLFLPTQHPAKPLLLEMLDKTDVSIPVPEGYGATVAFCALLDLVSTCQALIERPHSVLPTDVQLGSENEEQIISQQMISSIWCAVLAALSLMLESSSDESAGEAILKAMQACASLAGQLNLPAPRDAFVTALCKASLPPYYTLTILNTAAFGLAASSKASAGGSSGIAGNDITSTVDQSSAVVAVGSPLLCSSLILGPIQGPVVLTTRNIQCMRAVLSLAHCHGAVLGPAWHLVLATLQHLCWILGLRPAVGGSLRADRPVAADIALPPGSSVAQMGVQSDLPILAAMLSRLFESSQYLDEVALHHLLTALCNLSHECMEVAYAANREPSLFPVAKLLETGLVNLSRLEILWKPLTNHLLEVCQHPNATLRSYGVEAVVSLVRSAAAYQHNPPLRENKRLLTTILTPLVELSSTAASGSAASANADVRARQLDCLMHIVQSQGPLLSGVWPLILGVIGDINPQHGDALVRQSFRCLQIVTTDHLSTLDTDGLAQCIDTVAKFCSQQADLNISLTAVGLLWAIVDHLSQSRERPLEPSNSFDNATGSLADPAYPPEDALWMRVYRKLGDLCVDSRPPLRKSAAQTLFEALAAHTDRLRLQTLADLLWTVVFPLLESVRLQAGVQPSALFPPQNNQEDKCTESDTDVTDSKEKVSTSVVSSTTAEAKQWAEAHIVIISGASRLFSSRQRVIKQLEGCVDTWAALLDHLSSLAGSAMAGEVSHAAVRALLELCSSAWTKSSSPSSQDLAALSSSDQPDIGVARRSTVAVDNTKRVERVPYDNAWPSWQYIAQRFIKPSASVMTTLSISPQPAVKPEVPTQQKLTDLTRALVHLLPKINNLFNADDVRKLIEFLGGLVSIPVAAEAAPFVLPLNYEAVLTQLQESVVSVLQIQQEALLAGQQRHLLVQHFNGLLTLADMAVCLPPFPWTPPPSFATDQLPPIPAPQPRQIPAGLLPANVVPFGERCLQMATSLYTSSPAITNDQAVVSGRILQRFLRTLRGPLRLKYGCPARSTWLLAFDSLMAVLGAGLTAAKKNPTSAEYVNVWPELGGLLEEFLFCKQSPPSNLSIDELARDEACDCRLVEIVQAELLPGATSCGLPREFVLQLMHILNKGSVHSTSTEAFIDLRTNRHLRLDFAKKCFDTLLKFSCLQGPSSSATPSSPTSATNPTSLNAIALVALLDRCRSVVVNYAKDSRLSGELPLPRARSDEALLVLKALTMLVDWLIQTKNKNVSQDIWSRVIDLYPELITCTQVSNHTVTSAVLDVLMQYKHLLRAPVDPSVGLLQNKFLLKLCTLIKQ